jgi:hypothetical protein
MFLRDVILILLIALLNFLAILSSGQWLLHHYPHVLNLLYTPLLLLFVSLFVIIVGPRLHGKFKRIRLDKSVLVGEPFFMGNEIITFRMKPIFNKYIVFPEINGKRHESFFVFITTQEDSQVTAAVSRLTGDIRAVKAT